MPSPTQTRPVSSSPVIPKPQILNPKSIFKIANPISQPHSQKLAGHATCHLLSIHLPNQPTCLPTNLPTYQPTNQPTTQSTATILQPLSIIAAIQTHFPNSNPISPTSHTEAGRSFPHTFSEPRNHFPNSKSGNPNSHFKIPNGKPENRGLRVQKGF